MAIDVAVAGVIFLGHGQDDEDVYDHDDVCDYDHPSSLHLGGASILERCASYCCLPRHRCACREITGGAQLTWGGSPR